MALVEKYHVVATQFDVDPNSAEIKEGMLVTLTSSGVKRVSSSAEAKAVLGVAGDAALGSTSSMPGVGTGYISGGNTVSFQNRVSDGFDETKASGKITVYHSGGEFATDQYNTATALDGTKIGHILVASTGGVLTYGDADIGAVIGAGNTPVAQLTRAAGTYPSGVPGVDLNGDIALGGANNNQYIEFKLLV